MNEIYIKASDLGEGLVERINKETPLANGDILAISDIVDILDDLLYKIDKLEEEFEDYKQYIADNYKERSPYEMYGISERDFH
jgi:hypothetical protein